MVIARTEQRGRSRGAARSAADDAGAATKVAWRAPRGPGVVAAGDFRSRASPDPPTRRTQHAWGCGQGVGWRSGGDTLLPRPRLFQGFSQPMERPCHAVAGRRGRRRRAPRYSGSSGGPPGTPPAPSPARSRPRSAASPRAPPRARPESTAVPQDARALGAAVVEQAEPVARKVLDVRVGPRHAGLHGSSRSRNATWLRRTRPRPSTLSSRPRWMRSRRSS